MKMTMKHRTRIVPAGEFKAHCLALLDEVEATGQAIVVSKRGRPVARVVPIVDEVPDLRGSVVVQNDLLSPIDEDWDALR